MAEPVQIVCDEDTPERLLAVLGECRLDVVLSDAPITSMLPVKAFNHQLGSCGVTLFAATKLAARYRIGFPACLDGAPFLLPMEGGTNLRQSLEHWFDSHKIRPRVVGEFKDRALMKTFAESGSGIFADPSAIEEEIQEHYKVAVIGKIDSIVERFYPFRRNGR